MNLTQYGGRSRRLCWLLPLFALMAYPVPASAQYQFARIADTSGTFTGFGSAALSDNGTVAFGANFTANSSGFYGLFRSMNSFLTTIATNQTDSAPTSGFWNIGRPMVNDSGQVAFTAGSPTAVAGVHYGTGGAPITLADSSMSGFGEGFPANAAINNGGGVSFIAENDNSPSFQSVFVKQIGGGLTTIADANGPPFSAFYQTDINEHDKVAFIAQISSGRAIFLGDGNSSAGSIVDTTGSFSSFLSVVLNDSDDIVFRAANDGGGQSINKSVGGTLSEIANTVGSQFSVLDDPAVNDLGEVLFSARTTTSVPEGIFSGPNPVDDLILGSGDALDGSTITGIRLFRHGFNDSGQFVFKATLSDGREGIYLASSSAIPEPSATFLLAVGVLIIGLRRRNNH